MNHRCIYCGINFDAVNFSTLENVPKNLIQKLEVWLKPIIVTKSHANVHICEPCFKQLSKMKQGNLNRNICVGCGAPVAGDSIILYGGKLQVCRSWAPADICINHLDKACQNCYKKLMYFNSYKSPKLMKAETEFVGVKVNDPVEYMEEITEVKSESENSDHEEDCPSEQNPDDSISDQDHKIEEYDQSYDISNNNWSEEEPISINNIKLEPGYINYEFLEDTIDTPNSSHTQSEKSKNGSSGFKFKRQQKDDDDDDDYVPPAFLKNEVIPQRDYSLSGVTDYGNLTVELKNYKRTTRIGLCIFSECTEDCVSLVPRTVRRNMVLEHNLYIPFWSKVCQEHLQDQNWDDLLLKNTTTLFRAEHCQDLKNIVSEFCRTNFDFENIDTVDSKLVRYWLDVNKVDFKRIFNCFPKLKRLKEPKTAFAVYLMHLQKTSIQRIALLLTMREKVVKRQIIFVRGIIRCNNYESFKETFLPND